MSQFLTGRPLPGAQLNMSHPLTRGLVGCWLLQESGGIIAWDSSPYGNHGKLVGFASPPHRPFNGLPFGGAQYVDCGAQTSLNLTTGLTLEAWIKTSVGNDIVAKWDSTGNQRSYGMALWTAGELAFDLSSLGTGASNMSAIGGIRKGLTDLRDGKYHHCICTFAKPTIAICVDGKNDGGNQTAWNNSIFISITALRLGKFLTNFVAPFNGLICLARIWNRGLLPSDIMWLYAEPYSMFLT